VVLIVAIYYYEKKEKKKSLGPCCTLYVVTKQNKIAQAVEF